MREILFRGKRVDNGKWVEGFYCGDHPFINQSFIVIGSMEYHVIPKTVGQFTGLTDKNGIKAFEGDITDEGPIIWHEEYLGFFIKHKDGQHSPLYDIPFFEVIGNIHDNSENTN